MIPNILRDFFNNVKTPIAIKAKQTITMSPFIIPGRGTIPSTIQLKKLFPISEILFNTFIISHYFLLEVLLLNARFNVSSSTYSISPPAGRPYPKREIVKLSLAKIFSK